MTKAEKFIQDYTMGCSNEIEEGVYHEWLTPEQAKAAVEIARDEMLKEFEKERDERIKKVIRQVLNESTTEKDECYSNNRVTQQEVFAWIDKQGKQKKGMADAIAEFRQEFSEGDKIIRNRIIGYLKQDIEEHPERKERINEMIAYIDKQGEQKPAWSEDDEDYLHDVNAAVDNYFDVGLAKELRGWLYSLKERAKALKYYKQ